MSDNNTIIVDLIDENGNIEATFNPKIGQSFVEAAEDIDIEIPTSCCSGACFTCACRVIKGGEDIDGELLSMPLVDIEDNEILACISGLRDETFTDGQYHHIVLQKLL